MIVRNLLFERGKHKQQIDQLLYNLYGLTSEEITIAQNNVK